MATRYWTGATVTNVAQVATATFATYDTSTTRTITIGGVAISAADSGGTLTAALSALAVLLNASTHPYFSTITWTSNATQIIGTADTAGVPFVFAGSVSGGTGTLSNAYTVSTANASPHDWRTTTNWSGNTVPVNDDIVIFKDSDVSVYWGLDQSSVTPDLLVFEKSYTGKVGLDRTVFVTSADGDTTLTTVQEYRDTYLSIGPDVTRIGENYGFGSPAGSSRLMLNTGTTANCVIDVFDTAQSSSETGRPAVRLKANHSGTSVFVRLAPGGVGIACDTPGETSTVSKVSVSDDTEASRVFVGGGTTITTYEQIGGDNVLSAAATITTVTVQGGILTIEGDFTITTENIYGGTVYDNHVKTGGSAVTTMTINGGNQDGTGSRRARTWDTVNHTKGSLSTDGGVITITTLNESTLKTILVAS